MLIFRTARSVERKQDKPKLSKRQVADLKDKQEFHIKYRKKTRMVADHFRRTDSR